MQREQHSSAINTWEPFVLINECDPLCLRFAVPIFLIISKKKNFFFYSLMIDLTELHKEQKVDEVKVTSGRV